MLTHLWDEESGRFARGLIQKDNRWVKDMTLESSMFGIWEFGVLPVDDSRVIRTMNAIKEGLTIRTGVGGVARYTNDYYFQQSGDIENVPGNPWIICTLWIANFKSNQPQVLRILRNRSKHCNGWKNMRSRAVFCRSSSIRWTVLPYPLRLLLGHMQHSCKL